MSSRVYVGNVAYLATEEMLVEQFSAYGEVRSVTLLVDQVTGHSRGFALIEMATPEAAEKAAASLDGKELLGRYLRVDIADFRRGELDRRRR